MTASAGRLHGRKVPASAVVLLLAAVLAPRPAVADRLLVLGPPGSGVERRALAVIARDDGSCAPWEGVTLSAEEPGVQVTLEPAAVGTCARWIDVAASPAQSTVVLAVRGPRSSDARAVVAMGGDHGLRVRATRAEGSLRATIAGVPGPGTVVTASWRDGARILAASGPSAFTGEAPPDRLVAIVVRRGDLVGAAAVPAASGPPRSQALVVPSALAVQAGAAVRTAAFLIVTDRRGQLSRDVPLHVTSDRGRLRGLTWLAPGVAAVALTASAGVATVDLRAWTTEEAEAASVEIPVQADWPVGATIDAPALVEQGREFSVRASATLLGGEGSAADAIRLDVRCGDAAATHEGGGTYRCIAGTNGPLAVVASTIVDGRILPLAVRRVEVRAARTPPPPVVRARTIRTERARSDRRRPAPAVAPAAALGAGVSTAGGMSFRGGLGAQWAASRRILVSAFARYERTPVDLPGVDVVREPLVGVRHAAGLVLGGAVLLLEGRTSWVAGVAAGPSWVFGDLHVGQADARSTSLRLVARVSSGPRTRVGRLDVGLDLGLQLAPVSSERTWTEPMATAFLEITGALGR